MKEKRYIAITGANSGIGLALAEKFYKEGHQLLLLSHQIENVAHLQSPHVLCTSVDISNFGKLEELFLLANKKLGTLECLINNAGFLHAESLAQEDPVMWQKMINANLLGPTNMIQIAAKTMLKHQHGTIINVGSVAGRKTFENQAMYCATKHAIHALSDTIRQELAPYNIRVMTVAPGFVETNLYRHIENPDIQESLSKWSHSLEKLLSPREVAEFIYSLYKLPAHINIPEVFITPTRQI